ncbi:MAG: two-component system, response regulator YesN [Actinomycetota bacterium]|jgi:DNA-binding NarL/FixJ family response regulator|nr:two-component system, response regulator YesN [Actinomycetota bacterium]
MLRALIVDDDSDMRFLVRMTIEVANHGLSVAGEAASGADALDAVAQDRPGVVVLDNRMPGMTGLETARRILADHPEQSIILFSAYLDAQTKAEASAIGVRSCMDKTDVDRLPEALWQLAAGA